MTDFDDLIKQFQSDDPEVIREAAFAAGHSGDPALAPYLAKHLSSHNLGVQEAVDQALRRIGGTETVRILTPLLRSEEAPVRNLSMDILREIGKEDFPSLSKLLRDQDPDIRIFAADILGATGNMLAVEPLCDALLKDPEVNVRYQAAVSLGNLAYPESAPALNKAIADEEWVQFAVIESLTKVRAESSVNALIKAMSTSSDLVCSMIIDALGEMGNIKAVTLLLKRMDSSPAALRNKIVKAVVRILGARSLALLSEHERANFREYALGALQDEEEDIQDAAIQGLCSIGGEHAAKAVIDMAATLDPVSDQERIEHIIAALASMKFNGGFEQEFRSGSWKSAMIVVKTISLMKERRAVPLLMELFWDKDREMQREIITTLAMLAEPKHRDFFNDVLDRHSDGDVIKAAVYFLGIVMKSREDGERLFHLLEHPFNDVKEAALEACVAIGGEHMSSRFKHLFQSTEPLDRLMATYALGKLGVQDNLEEIRLALEDEVPDIRKVAIKALADVRLDIKDFIALVSPRLTDENNEVRLAVVELLGACREEQVDSFLLQALDDADDWVRIRAIEALAGRNCKEAVRKLIPLLEYPNKLIVLKVIDALGSMGGQASFRALLELLNHEDYEVQAAAEEAVTRIREAQGEQE